MARGLLIGTVFSQMIVVGTSPTVKKKEKEKSTVKEKRQDREEEEREREQGEHM